MKLIYALASLSLCTAFAQAAPLLSVVPQMQIVDVGAPISVDIEISGLTGSLALGTFDIALATDPGLLVFNSASFGNQLDVLGLGSIQAVTPSPGSVGLFELSLDSPSDLASLQADAFRLATLTFTALAASAGTTLNLSISALGDADGAAIVADTANARVAINSIQTPVPEPPSWALVLAGAAAVGWSARRKSGRKGPRSCHA